MKKLIMALLVQLTSIAGKAQTNQTAISGTIINENRFPVESATVSLLKSGDSSLVKMDVSEKSGQFIFSGIPHGSYVISVSISNSAYKIFPCICSFRYIASD